MPYLPQEERVTQIVAKTPGQLNYVITKLCDYFITANGGVSYRIVNEVIGILECAKLELYRRVLAEYEDKKRAENGDVYECTEV